jgi:hypothetical protein
MLMRGIVAPAQTIFTTLTRERLGFYPRLAAHWQV